MVSHAIEKGTQHFQRRGSIVSGNVEGSRRGVFPVRNRVEKKKKALFGAWPLGGGDKKETP